MRSLLVLFLAVFGSTTAHAIEFHKALPAIARKPEIQRIRKEEAGGLIERFRQDYLRKARSGALDQPSDKKLRREDKLVKLALKVNKMLRDQKDDRPIVVLVDGPNGAGKSSTMRRFKVAFEGAREIVEHHIGRPPDDHEDIHWLKRFVDILPKKRQVAFLDRSQIGRAVWERLYKMIDKKEVKQTLRETNDFEGMLRDKVRIVKFYLDVPDEGLASNIAKREVLAPDKLEESDYTSFRDRDTIRAYYEHAVAKTGREVKWHRIDMSEGRYKGRADMLRILKKELE
jgi:polyphosphate kinase 2 (PPK2 family)